jgi:hypothetical protein
MNIKSFNISEICGAKRDITKAIPRLLGRRQAALALRMISSARCQLSSAKPSRRASNSHSNASHRITAAVLQLPQRSTAAWQVCGLW